MEPQLRSLKELQAALARQIAELVEQGRILSQTSVDIQMIQVQLRTLDQVLANFVTEKERLGMEVKSAANLRAGNGGRAPGALQRDPRLALTAAAMLLTFCCVAAVVVLGYAITRRKTAAEG